MYNETIDTNINEEIQETMDTAQNINDVSAENADMTDTNTSVNPWECRAKGAGIILLSFATGYFAAKVVRKLLHRNS